MGATGVDDRAPARGLGIRVRGRVEAHPAVQGVRVVKILVTRKVQAHACDRARSSAPTYGRTNWDSGTRLSRQAR
jgi:hypothetical protein